MGASPQVVFYGNSMFLAGIQAQLECLTTLKLIKVAADCPDAAGLVDSCNPLAVFFDLAADHPKFAVSLLHRHPGLLLIGVDPSSNELLVLSSRPHQALSVADLVEVMQRECGGEKLEGDS